MLAAHCGHGAEGAFTLTAGKDPGRGGGLRQTVGLTPSHSSTRHPDASTTVLIWKRGPHGRMHVKTHTRAFPTFDGRIDNYRMKTSSGLSWLLILCVNWAETQPPRNLTAHSGRGCEAVSGTFDSVGAHPPTPVSLTQSMQSHTEQKGGNSPLGLSLSQDIGLLPSDSDQYWN